jgi:hypothetical protein
MKVINLTPHAIVIRTDEREITIPPSGKVARVAVATTNRGSQDIDGVLVPVVAQEYGCVEGLPEDKDEFDACIVSYLVLSRCAGMKGIYAPDTGPTAVRDEKGQIAAVTRLISAE